MLTHITIIRAIDRVLDRTVFKGHPPLLLVREEKAG